MKAYFGDFLPLKPVKFFTTDRVEIVQATSAMNILPHPEPPAQLFLFPTAAPWSSSPATQSNTLLKFSTLLAAHNTLWSSSPPPPTIDHSERKTPHPNGGERTETKKANVSFSLSILLIFCSSENRSLCSFEFFHLWLRTRRYCVLTVPEAWKWKHAFSV